MGMFQEDIVYGGDRLDQVVEKGALYVLFDCGVVAENVETSLQSAEGATKVELILGVFDADEKALNVGQPFIKAGTFASAIVAKVKRKAPGDLPAVVKFETVESKQWGNDAFVMTFVERYSGDAPQNLPRLSPTIDPATPPFD